MAAMSLIRARRFLRIPHTPRSRNSPINPARGDRAGTIEGQTPGWTHLVRSSRLMLGTHRCALAVPGDIGLVCASALPSPMKPQHWCFVGIYLKESRGLEICVCVYTVRQSSDLLPCFDHNRPQRARLQVQRPHNHNSYTNTYAIWIWIWIVYTILYAHLVGQSSSLRSSVYRKKKSASTRSSASAVALARRRATGHARVFV